MPKFIVNIYGKIPDCMEVEAADQDTAEELALENVMDELNFEAEEVEPGTPAPCAQKSVARALDGIKTVQEAKRNAGL